MGRAFRGGVGPLWRFDPGRVGTALSIFKKISQEKIDFEVCQLGAEALPNRPGCCRARFRLKSQPEAVVTIFYVDLLIDVTLAMSVASSHNRKRQT